MLAAIRGERRDYKVVFALFARRAELVSTAFEYFAEMQCYPAADRAVLLEEAGFIFHIVSSGIQR
jgi:hypothetical protein